MKKVCILLLLSLCSYFSFFSQSVLAGEGVANPTIRTWEEFSNPEKLINIEEFLDGGYQEAFWTQVGEFNSQFRRCPAMPGCTAYWAQLGARYLVWHLQFEEDFLSTLEEEIFGESDHYGIVLVNNPINDPFLNAKFQGAEMVCSSTVFEIVKEINKDILPFLGILGGGNFLVMAYDSSTNQIRVDKRIMLPPAIWMVFLNHQERHVADDIYNQNKVISDMEALTMLDAAAIADGIHTWKLLREEFLRNWTSKGLDSKPEYIIAKICLADILLAEPLFKKDLENKKLKYLKEYSMMLFLRR